MTLAGKQQGIQADSAIGIRSFRSITTRKKKGQKADLLRARAINLEEEPADGKLAFIFTGQGSQYLDMGLDLAEKFEIVRKTFENDIIAKWF